MNFKIRKNSQIVFLCFISVCSLYASQNIIKVINYNIHGLSPMLIEDKNCDRVESIFENTSKKYDLILDQNNYFISSDNIDISSLIVNNLNKQIINLNISPL